MLRLCFEASSDLHTIRSCRIERNISARLYQIGKIFIPTHPTVYILLSRDSKRYGYCITTSGKCRKYSSPAAPEPNLDNQLSIIFSITIEIRLVVIYFLLILDEACQDAENEAKQLVKHNGAEDDQASQDVHDPSKESGQF